jgi:CheY-like chemotaxis protein
VESTPGQGSSFSFTCRFRLNEQLVSSLQIRESKARDNLVDQREQLDNIRGALVLLVDDNEVNQQVAAGLLKESGLIPDFAANGQEAVAAMRRRDYDLVFMDLQMPIMSGYEATALIRENDRYAELPIIAMTAHAMKGVREGCLAAGMSDYLSKPINPVLLHEMLVKWIGHPIVPPPRGK